MLTVPRSVHSLTGLVVLVLFVALTPLSLRARPPSPAPPLAPPGGAVVNVSTAPQLQAAVQHLRSNTTIVLAPGTYQLTSSLYINGTLTNVGIRGATNDRDDVVLLGPGMTNATFGDVPYGISTGGNVQSLTIANLTIRDIYHHAIMFTAGTENPHVYNVHLVDSGEQFIESSSDGGGVDNGIVEYSVIEYTTAASGANTGGIDVHTGANWIIRHNLFRNIVASPGELAGPAVQMWASSSNTLTEGNAFWNCAREIAYGFVNRDAGFDHTGGVIRNNFVYRSGARSGDVAISLADSPDTQVLNNTVYLSGTYPTPIEYRFGGTTGVLLANNLVDGFLWARDGATGTEQNNLTGATADMFVNAAAGDLHLSANATSAIDRGVTLAAVTDDFDGQARPVGAANDIGADEYGASSNTTPTPSKTAAASLAASTLAPMAAAAPVAVSIWSASATPSRIATTDTSAVELGVRFRTDTAGTLTGLRFYKGAGNTGTHLGHLWTNAGVLLATATFSGETASGWQQVMFSSPVALTVNTTYVASYHTTTGQYAVDNSYFATTGVDNAPLHALANGVGGANSVYLYGGSAFPTQTYLSSNYWVDVVFMASSGGDTTAPTVAITAPVTGATVSGSAVTIAATASDNVGVVGVQVKVDGVNLGAEDTTSPYSNVWNTTTVANGTHTVTAVARDAAGNTATSTAVTVTVNNSTTDTTPPTVSITAPAAGATVSGSAVTISAAAADNVGVVGVQVKVDGLNLGAEDTTSPYSNVWNTTTVANGTHTVTAVARDAAGNTATSTAVTVTVANADTTAPTVSITAPAAGATVSGAVTISATAADNVGVVGVQVKVDSVNLGAEDTTSPYSNVWNTTTVANGTHTVTAVARDAAGNTATSTAVTVTVNNSTVDTTPPTVSITAPAAGATVSGAVTIAATAADNVGVVGVQFKLDGANLGVEDTTSPYGVTWDTSSATNGNHALTAVARDAAGNTTTSTAVTVTVNNASSPSSTIWSAATTPSRIETTDTNAIELGVRFSADRAGTLTGLRFYKGAGNTGTHLGHLWTNAGVLLATATFSGETASGWQQVMFSSPVALTVNTTYVASYHTTTGQYAVDNAYFATTGVDNAPLHALMNGVGGANSVYTYGASVFPTQTYQSSNYWVDVVFMASGGGDTTAPTVAITAPATGATVSGSAVTIAATAADNVGVVGVQVKVDGVNLGAEDTTSPYSNVWNTTTVANGTHTVTAVARDAAGNTTTSTAVTVTVNNSTTDTTPPTVSITAPAAGATVSGSAVTIAVAAADNVGVVGVQVKVDGVNLGAEDTTSPYSNVWNTTTVANGTHTVTAVARDAAGNTTTSTAVTVTVNNSTTDTTPPTVSITAPAAGATVSGAVTISATAADNVGVVGVQVKVDGVNLGAEDTTSPYSNVWNTTTVANGTHTVTAVARDAAGNTATSTAVTVTVNNSTVDTTPPTVSITAPAAGATVSGTVTIAAAAADNVGVVGVQVKVDGVNLGAEDTTSPYSNAWNTTTVADGTHTVTAVARDAAGNTTTSAAVTVTVSNAVSTPPTTVIFQESTDNNDGLVTSYRLDVFANGADPNTATAVASSDLGKPAPDGVGDITVDRTTFFAAIAHGTYVMTVSSIGATGLGRSASVTMTW